MSYARNHGSKPADRSVFESIEREIERSQQYLNGDLTDNSQRASSAWAERTPTRGTGLGSIGVTDSVDVETLLAESRDTRAKLLSRFDGTPSQEGRTPKFRPAPRSPGGYSARNQRQMQAQQQFSNDLYEQVGYAERRRRQQAESAAASYVADSVDSLGTNSFRQEDYARQIGHSARSRAAQVKANNNSSIPAAKASGKQRPNTTGASSSRRRPDFAHVDERDVANVNNQRAVTPVRSARSGARSASTRNRPTGAMMGSTAASRSRAEAVHSERNAASVTPTRSRTPLRSVTPQARIADRMAVQARQSTLRKEQLRAESSRDEMKDCTFHPKINHNSVKYALRSRAWLSKPLVDRLHHEADERITMRNKARDLLRQEEITECTFHPKTTPHAATEVPGRAPIQERVGYIEKKKQDQLHEKRLQVEEKSGCTFKPKISQKSLNLVHKRRQAAQKSLVKGNTGHQIRSTLGPVEERLHSDHVRRHREREMVAEESAETHSFKPEINPVSELIVQQSEILGADFQTRQEHLDEVRRQRAKHRQHKEYEECTFRPQLSQISEMLVQSDVTKMGETIGEKSTRLSKIDAEKRRERQQQIEKTEYQECKFQPQINDTSRAIAEQRQNFHNTAERMYAEGTGSTAPTVHDRLYNQAHEEKPLSTTKSAEQKQLEECTFQPKINKARFKYVRPTYAVGRGRDKRSMMDQIKDRQINREQRVEAARQMKEYEDLRDCTFQPKLRAKTPDRNTTQDNLVLVRGLDRFFQLRQKQRDLEAEKRDRENKVFGTSAAVRGPQDHTARHCGVTVPEPFALSEGQHKKGGSYNTREEKECTFKPRTIEARHREMVRKILSNDDTLGLQPPGPF